MGGHKYKLVLVVDDNDIETFITSKTINDNDFAEKIITFLSAKEGLEYLKANENNTEKLPSIIFLDIIMPKMDGFAFLDEFDKMNDTIHKQCKVVLLSTSESLQDLNRANKNKYVSKFLTKPLMKEALEALNF